MQRARIALTICVIALAGMTGFQLVSHIPSGIVGMTKRTDGIGCPCHYYEPTPAVRVWIEGPDSVRAGGTAMFAIRVARDTNQAAGFNVAAFRGRLQVADSVGTQLLPAGDDSLELTHSWPRLRSGSDTISWAFAYRAPNTPGFRDTLYAVGNSVNGDTLANEFDRWNYNDPFIVRVIPSTSVMLADVPGNFGLLQNYPNPFNPATELRWTMPVRGLVRLIVYDVAGREVRVLVSGERDAGMHAQRWDASGVPSGVYFIRLEVTALSANGGAGDQERTNSQAIFTQTRKALLIR